MTSAAARPDEGVDVSVVVPAYNVERYLATALDRLLAQTHPGVEIVVVDDASTDASAEIARGYAERHARVVFVAQQTNQGVAAARERAVAECRGDHVWFVDADDDWSDDAVATLLAAARDTGAAVVCANAVYVTPDGGTRAVGRLPLPGPLSGADAFRALLRGDLTGHLWNKLFARSLLTGIDFTRSRHHSDQAMVAQLLAAAPTVALVEPVVYRYLLRSGSIIRSGTPRSQSLETVAAVVRRTAAGLDPSLLRSQDYRYYRARFELLSRMKDATSGAYDPAEAARLVRAVRRDTTSTLLGSLARARDTRRLAMLVAARWHPGLYRLVMRAPGARS